MLRLCIVLTLGVVVFACGGAEPAPPASIPLGSPSVATPPTVAAPTGKLPSGVAPLAYRLDLSIIPDRERFAGAVEIDLQVDQPTQRIYLHALSIAVKSVDFRSSEGVTVPATFRSFDNTGVAALELDAPIAAGRYVTRIVYDAPFDTQLKGLYRVHAGDQDYAFTQFEAIAARQAFPCFDEPRFKTPFQVRLTVRATDRAIANTSEIGAELLPDGLRSVRFATTEPLPTYLVAFAVGPLDVIDAPPIAANDVRARPLPFRAIAVQGKGKDLAHAIAHTPAMVAELEGYFGIAYPYDKLDIIAVPDFAAGAMENAGAITFREPLLLLDALRATEGQRRGFAYVMAHELAHQWFGNLVTMPWWDDIWLNEAFATWMGYRVVQALHREHHAEIDLLEHVQFAMSQDSLASARVIRQPIETSHDILNAFDAITYSKGGGVLSMFERYLGPEVFRQGIRQYMTAHRFGTATTIDLIAALSAAHGHDLQAAFGTFLDQAGVPLLETRLECTPEASRLHLTQSRYVPLGSTAERERVWNVPLCVRWGVGDKTDQTCSLIEQRQSVVTLPVCPDWFLPNADASAYVRFALAAPDLERLPTRGLGRLNVREQLALVDALSSGFAAGSVDAKALLSMAKVLAAQSERAVVTAPMGWLAFAREHADSEAQRSKIEAFGRTLYTPHKKRLGWVETPDDDGETRLLRAEVLGFLALEAQDTAVRREAVKRGRAYLGLGSDGAIHPEAVATDLVDVVLTVTVQEGNEKLFDHVVKLLHGSADAVLRDRLLGALGGTRDPVLSARALALGLDPAVRVNETLTPLSRQLREPTRRDAAWTWLTQNIEGVLSKVGPARGGRMPWLGATFCATDGQEKVRALFTPRLETLNGGPRNLNGALEAIALCAAKVDAQRASTAAFFAQRTPQ